MGAQNDEPGDCDSVTSWPSGHAPGGSPPEAPSFLLIPDRVQSCGGLRETQEWGHLRGDIFQASGQRHCMEAATPADRLQ